MRQAQSLRHAPSPQPSPTRGEGDRLRQRRRRIPTHRVVGEAGTAFHTFSPEGRRCDEGAPAVRVRLSSRRSRFPENTGEIQRNAVGRVKAKAHCGIPTSAFVLLIIQSKNKEPRLERPIALWDRAQFVSFNLPNKLICGYASNVLAERRCVQRNPSRNSHRGTEMGHIDGRKRP